MIRISHKAALLLYRRAGNRWTARSGRAALWRAEKQCPELYEGSRARELESAQRSRLQRVRSVQ